MTYATVIQWSGEEKAFVAYHPELQGCIAVGETREEALRLLDEFREAWLGLCKERGEEAPAPQVFDGVRGLA